jgi:hypothetical protein
MLVTVDVHYRWGKRLYCKFVFKDIKNIKLYNHQLSYAKIRRYCIFMSRIRSFIFTIKLANNPLNRSRRLKIRIILRLISKHKLSNA